MTNDSSDDPRAARRQRAEAALLAREGTGAPTRSDVDAAALLHELRVHEIELEMQNEELRRSYDELAAVRDKYADLYDFAPVGYFTIAPDAEILEANLTGAGLLGLERGQLRGQRLTSFLGASDRDRLERAIVDVWRREATESLEVALAEGPVTSPRPSRVVQLTLQLAPGGGALRVACLDVTERRRAEDQVRTAQKLEAIGQLAGGVAHDFNNVLTVILSNAELALIGLPADSPLHECMTELKAAGERAAGLTRQLLAFSRKQVVRPEVVDVNERVRKTAGLLRRLLGEDIELVLELTSDPARVVIDPVQLDQVVMNLAVNARDAMPHGGTLTLRTERRARTSDWLVGAGDPPAHGVRLTVEDTGTGIAPQAMPHLFEPFFTTKDVGHGTGLGLSTVFGIVEASGGRVAAHSELGRGARFEIDLPCHELPPGTERAVAEAAGEVVDVRGSETVLVVEDEPALLKIIARSLSGAGYRVLTASNGREGLRKSEEHEGPLPLLVSDIIMPGMTGVALAERIRKQRPEARVLLMSGYTGDALASRGFHELQVPLLIKPFTPQQLARRVRAVLDAPPPG